MNTGNEQMNDFLIYRSSCSLCFDASQSSTSGPALLLWGQIHTPCWQPEQMTLGHLGLDTSERELIKFLTAAYLLPLLPV